MMIAARIGSFLGSVPMRRVIVVIANAAAPAQAVEN
jgi:hypothetical protein